MEPRWLLAANPFAFVQTNLVANAAGAAPQVDSNLVNPRGIALGPASGPFWIVNQATGVATRYSGDVGGSPLVVESLVVSIPGGSPTGATFNGTSDFILHSGADSAPATFLVSSNGGQISGWNVAVPAPSPSSSALAVVTSAGADYRGLATGVHATGNILYAANFAQGRVDIFDAAFQTTTLEGRFVDPSIPANYAPFNIANLAGKLYVTYAERGAAGQFGVGAGKGFVSVFDTAGHLLRSLLRGGPSSSLNAPWGLALAPDNWGLVGGKLLVGNFGDGAVQAYDLQTGSLSTTLRDDRNQVIHIDGLWGLSFGNDASAGDERALYFTAGGAQQTSGLFGALRPAVDSDPPPPPSPAITGAGVTFTAPYGQSFTTLVATFTDGRSNAQASDFVANIDWGDGQASAGAIVANNQGGFDVRGTHRYDLPGRYDVAVAISRTDGSAFSTANSAATVGTADERFLAKAYLDLLHRQADAGGLAYWKNVLDATTREFVVLGIEATSEFLGAVVSDLFQAILNRPADDAGKTYFTGQLAAGATFDGVRTAMLSSQEYFVAQGQQQTLPYLTAVLGDSLHADFPIDDPPFLNDLQTRLNGGHPRAEAVDLIFARTERWHGLVQFAYERYLGRKSDTNGRTYFVQSMQAGAREERLISALVSSDEYYRQL